MQCMHAHLKSYSKKLSVEKYYKDSQGSHWTQPTKCREEDEVKMKSETIRCRKVRWLCVCVCVYMSHEWDNKTLNMQHAFFA